MPAKEKLLRLAFYALLVIAVLVWALQFEVKSALDEAPSREESPQAEDPLIAVQISESQAVPYTRILEVQGQVEPYYAVALRAEVAARVLSVPVKEGDRVAEGALLLELDQESRQAQLERAQAILVYKQQELEANRRLAKIGGSTRTEVLRLASEVADARFALEEARLGLSRTRPLAPFEGVLDELLVDPGDYLNQGEIWGRLVDIDRLRVSAWVAQQDVAALAPGAAGGGAAAGWFPAGGDAGLHRPECR